MGACLSSACRHDQIHQRSLRPSKLTDVTAVPPCRRRHGRMEREQRKHFVRNFICQPRWSGLSRPSWLSCIMATALFEHRRDRDHRLAVPDFRGCRGRLQCDASGACKSQLTPLNNPPLRSGWTQYEHRNRTSKAAYSLFCPCVQLAAPVQRRPGPLYIVLQSF